MDLQAWFMCVCCYALSHAMSGTRLCCYVFAMLLRPCYAMSGTDIGFRSQASRRTGRFASPFGVDS
eukprot:811695-Rhodomonas_salina.1